MLSLRVLDCCLLCVGCRLRFGGLLCSFLLLVVCVVLLLSFVPFVVYCALFDVVSYLSSLLASCSFVVECYDVCVVCFVLALTDC